MCLGDSELDTGLVKFDWNFIDTYTEEEISYFLTLEGKSLDVVAKIRNLDRATVQRHVINAKIKYRYLVKSNSMEDLFKSLSGAVKDERIRVLNSLDKVNKEKLIHFLLSSYMDLTLKEKEAALWIMGEVKNERCIDILIKATVNNHVNIRRMSISALGKIGDKKAERALIRALDDANGQVVTYAIKALKRINSDEAKNKINELMKTAEKEYVKKACENFLLEEIAED